jgi:hypothetical protein
MRYQSSVLSLWRARNGVVGNEGPSDFQCNLGLRKSSRFEGPYLEPARVWGHVRNGLNQESIELITPLEVLLTAVV